MAEQALIGLIGGMSWESSAQYYRLINEGVRDRIGGVASARTLMWSFNFARIEALMAAASGAANVNEAASGNAGSISANSLEASTVDLATR